MRVFGVIGIILTVLFLISLLVAIASNGGISKDEFAPVAYFFGTFVMVMCISAVRVHGAPAKLAPAVLGLGVAYLALYTIEWAASEKQSYRKRYESQSYRIKSDDLHVAAGGPLSIAAIAIGSSLARKRHRQTGEAAGTVTVAG